MNGKNVLYFEFEVKKMVLLMFIVDYFDFWFVVLWNDICLWYSKGFGWEIEFVLKIFYGYMIVIL